MATNSLLHSLHRSLLHHRHRHHSESPSSTLSSSPFLKPTTATTTTTTAALSHSFSSALTFSLSASTTTSASTSQSTSLDLLQQHLSAQNFRQADDETRRLIIALAGEPAIKRGYVFFSEVQFISETDLKAIDDLWRQHSDNKFGYSVQKKIYEKANQDFSKFFIKVGWMKKLDTEVDQYNYRSFPTEFIWELTDETPVGHLPLTNALRGTQLLKCIFSHPAFEGTKEDENEDKIEEEKGKESNGSPLLNKRVFKTDYSF